MRAAADTACSSNRKSSKSDSLNNQGLLFILFSPPMCLLLLLVFNDVAGVNRRKTLHRHGMVVSAHGPPKLGSTSQQFRWALTPARRPTDRFSSSLVTDTGAGASWLCLVRWAGSDRMGLSRQCLSHSQPGCTGQTLFDPSPF